MFTLEDFPRDDQNAEYLVVSASYDLEFSGYESMPDSAGTSYQCSFVAMPSKQQFRPRRATPKPFVQGPQTAVVVGPGGEEIYTDKYGRVKVQFHWDRYGKKDENSSCWIRVSSPWAGKAWGTISTPRIGQEVVVAFLEGDPDQPIIVGRVYNAEQMPPYDLPGNKTQSGMKSRSSMGGGPIRGTPTHWCGLMTALDTGTVVGVPRIRVRMVPAPENPRSLRAPVSSASRSAVRFKLGSKSVDCFTGGSEEPARRPIQ